MRIDGNKFFPMQSGALTVEKTLNIAFQLPAGQWAGSYCDTPNIFLVLLREMSESYLYSLVVQTSL